MNMLKLLYRLTMPGGFLLLLTFSLIRLGILAGDDRAYTHWYPAIVFGVSLLLSAVFHRSRLFFALLTVALVQTALAWPGLMSSSTQRIVFAAVALLLPLNLLAFCFLRDRGIISPGGKNHLLCIVGEILTIATLTLPRFGRAAAFLNYDFLPRRFTQWSGISQLALCVFLLAAAVITVALARRYRVIENSLLWTLAASFIALRAGGASHLAAAYFAAAGLVLAVAVLETSYNMAYQDELTRLPRRRALNEALLKLGDSYSIAMVDVDHFKKFNDTYGHAAGDEALRMVASRLAHVTGGGKAYRYGGEEFAVLFPNKPAEEAFTYLDGMRRLISQSTFVVRGRDRRRRGGKKPPGKVETKVTVSVGIAARNGEKFSIEEVLRCADKALYKARARGRNCTVTGKPAKSATATTTMRVLQME